MLAFTYGSSRDWYSTSAKSISIWAQCQCPSGRAPSEPSDTSRCWIRSRLASIASLALHIALQAQFCHFFLLNRSHTLNDHSGAVARCDHMLEWVHIVHDYNRIAMQWVMLRKSLLTFLLPAHNMQLSLYELYTSFEVARSIWLLPIDCLFFQSPVLLLVAICGIPCAQPTMFPTLKTCKATAACGFLTCTNFVTGSKLPNFSDTVSSARASQYSTKAPSLFRSLILYSHCSRHWRSPFSAPWHHPGHCFTHTQSFHRSPPRWLWLPVYRHIRDMRSPSIPSTWTLIPWWIQSSIACSYSTDIYTLLQLLCLINSR